MASKDFDLWFIGAPVLQTGSTGDFAYWFIGAPVLQFGVVTPRDLVRDESIPVESGIALQSLVLDAAIPIDSLGAVVGLIRDEAIPVEAGQGIQRDVTIPVESHGSLRITAEIPVESLGSLVRDDDIPIDSEQTRIALTRDEAIPVEAVTGVTRDDEIPIDSTAVAVLTLDRDEAIPIDASTVPITPSDLVVFYGAGAPWPPSWLVRAPLLNRTQHCAVLYLGGTSWSTFTGSELPPRPSHMVKPVKAPRRIRKPHPTPAHPGYVRAGHSSIIWLGGRSTEATRIDRAAVMKQDEEDFMTLLALL